MSVMTIPADLLFTPCPVEWLTTAADGDGGGAHPGQKRALDALTYGLDLHGEGYNLYISGPPASGKYEMVRRVVEEVAADRPVPADICYVNNFASPHQPRMLNLPAGRGRQLRSDMRELVESLLITVPEALRGDEFKAQLDTIRAGYQEQENNAFEKLSVRAVDKGFVLMRTPGGYTIAPMKDGKPMGKEDLEQLSEEESNRLQENLGELNKDLQDTVKQIPAWQTEARERCGLPNQLSPYPSSGRPLPFWRTSTRTCRRSSSFSARCAPALSKTSANLSRPRSCLRRPACAICCSRLSSPAIRSIC